MTPNQQALKPCPFCGGDAQFNEHAEDCYFTVLREAKNAPKSDISPALNLLAAWNTRAIESATLAAIAQQAQEPVGDRYFSYSTDLGFDEYPTRDEAIECANTQIKYYREDAIRDDEWPDEVDSVCWGVILGRSKEIDTSNEDHESVDYKLYTTPPAPQVPAPVDEREAFERWCGPCSELRRSDFDPGRYCHSGISLAWGAWQARAALQSPAPQTKGQP